MLGDQISEGEKPFTPDANKHCITLKIHIKSAVIWHLLKESHGKINRVVYDIFI
jgi:hypothetical protein